MSVFGETELVQKQAGVQESSGPFVANASELIQIRCESDLAFLLGKCTKYSDSKKKKFFNLQAKTYTFCCSYCM